ncbi:hypothetical protein B4N84_27460 [Flavobacterium sp. IR1]|nr:hypothetical protein B4N84_27460 [Flavobacterium sp. IR1]
MKKKNILLIDDDPDDTEIFVEAVKTLDKDIEITISNNSLEALQNLKIASDIPDYIFLDMQMPYLSGTEFCEEIAKQPNLSKIKVVIYSSHSANRLKEMTKDIKTAHYLSKPNSFTELVEILNTIL